MIPWPEFDELFPPPPEGEGPFDGLLLLPPVLLLLLWNPPLLAEEADEGCWSSEFVVE